MKKKILPVLFLVCLSATPTFARADWQYTKWGMSREQLAAAAKAAGTNLSFSKTPSANGAGIASYAAAGVEFSAHFDFEDGNGQLSKVKLLPSDMTKCKKIADLLLERYEQPATNEITTLGGLKVHSLTWNDRKERNAVKYVNFGEIGCNIDYTPLRLGAKNGL